MSIWEMLGKIVTGPLELMLDVLYTFAYEFTRSPGLSVAVLSLIVNLLILPLYLRADRIQEEDKDQSARMKPGIDKIKRAFRGDEQYLVLQTYYRQNHYKPYYALKSLLPLLLQVPFFIAAYRYLSGLQLLLGTPFGPISDLASPDALLKIGAFTVNVLPVAMTVINLLSGAVYSKGMPLKSKVQMLLTALVFLVLLYNSPSGLVLYWTLNNVFSLVKNLFMRLKHRGTILKGCCSAAGIALIVLFLFIRPINDSVRRSILITAAAALQLPALSALLKKWKVLPASFRGIPHTKTTKAIFWGSCLFLALLTGVLIPAEVMKSSPAEFADISNYQNPLRYILHSFLLAAGVFLFWSPVFYCLSSEKRRGTISLALAVFALVSLINYSAFGGEFGDMNSLLQYENKLTIRSGQILAGLLIIPAAAVLLFFLIRKAPGLLAAVCITGCIALVAVSAADVAAIHSSAEEIRIISENTTNETPSFRLSRTGKNVVVIMLDRAVSGFVPYIMNEKPELQEKYDGFTFYPNTISFGCHTNVGSPPLFGGYEYTPDRMNARSDERLADKQNEALRVMPVMFDEAGYDVTVFDPPYANYSWSTDVSIYEDHPDIHGYPALGKYVDDDRAEMTETTDMLRERNMFCYSIFRTSSPVLQKVLYNNGEYNSSSVKSNVVNNTDFVDSYLLMRNLSAMTEITDECENGCFFMMDSNITHGGEILQEPDYVLSKSVDNREYEKAHRIRTTADGQTLNIGSAGVVVQKHYHGNMSALLLIGDWLDYLRENGVYDNTRIILVADHAYYLGLFGFDLREKYAALPPGEERYGDYWTDTMSYVPLLMVKDFDAKGFRTDDTFMTNADTPFLAAEGVIENPVNPGTGMPITTEPKRTEDMHIVLTDWHIDKNDGNVFKNQMHITLRNRNVFDMDNWTIENAVPRGTGG